MSDGLQTLLEALYRLGNEDIYTDSWEYRGRRQAMGALLGLVGRHLKGERITAQKVKDAADIAKLGERN